MNRKQRQENKEEERGNREEEGKRRKKRSEKKNYFVPAKGCKKISPMGFTKEMPSCPPAVISSLSEACPPGERRVWLADQCCMLQKCDISGGLHSFPLSPGVTLQPSSDIGSYNVKPSFDPASTKLSEVTLSNAGFSVQQGKNAFVLNRKKKWNIFHG